MPPHLFRPFSIRDVVLSEGLMTEEQLQQAQKDGARFKDIDQYFLESYTARSGHDLRDRACIYQALALVRMASRRFETGISSFREGELADQPSGVLLREAMACLELG